MISSLAFNLHELLSRFGDGALSIALLGVAIIAVLLALFASPRLKAGALAWLLFP